MKYDILLATNDKDVTDNFKKIVPRNRVKLDTVNTPVELNRLFNRSKELIDLMILDSDFSEADLDRIMFYIRQYNENMPIVLLHGSEMSFKEGEIFRNLMVYKCMERSLSKIYFEKWLDLFGELLDDDMDKKIEKVEYLEQENVFACTFKNMKTYFLKRSDISKDDGSKLKYYQIDKDQYHFTVYLESEKEYAIVWDFIRSLYDKEYKYYRENVSGEISSEKIGERISQLRKIQKLTQEDLATKTGIQRANISRIEGGKHYPSLETLEKIADALSVPVARFLAK